MQTLTQSKHRLLGREIIGKLRSGIINNERFEILSDSIINDITYQLLLVDDFENRKGIVTRFYSQVEKAQMIKQYHLSYQSPVQNKQLSAALNHLKGQFKMRFAKYLH